MGLLLTIGLAAVIAPALGPTAAVAATASTTIPVRPAAAKPAVVAAPRAQLGKGSWYRHLPGICAHRSLPFGTVVKVTSTATGKSTTCKVGDRGPFIKGWIIDLHPREFERLAPRSAGVISVRVTW